MYACNSPRPPCFRQYRLETEYEIGEGVYNHITEAHWPLTCSGSNVWAFTVQSKEVSDGVYEFKVTGEAAVERKYGKGYCKLSVLDEQSDEIWSSETTTESPLHNCFQFSRLLFINEDCKILRFVLNMGSCFNKKPGVTEILNRWIDSHQRMLDNGILTDCTIKTKEKDFPCHIFVLASNSEYFRAMFELDMKERREKVIDWVDIFDAETVQDLLQYLYTGKTPNGIEKTYEELVEAASLCMLDELKELCAFVMTQIIDVDSAAKILQLAEKHELCDLKESALHFVLDNYTRVRETMGWEERKRKKKI